MKTISIVLIIFLNVIGTLTQTTYIWSGAVNSNFSTAGNWTPIRQVGLTSDKLVFNSGTVHDITNVYQVTIAQLSVLNNTHVKLTPTQGNPKTIFIQGEENTDSGNNPERNENIADTKYQEYMNSGTSGYPDNKYNEYMRSDSSELAALKYGEYIRPDSTDPASLKYNEYRNPPANGMGDLKEENTFDTNGDEDLFIDTGSSLDICGSNPKLKVFIKQNASAVIKGTLTFTGAAENEINSSDPYSISFKTGSALIQSCPGSIFSTAGPVNSANFEDGSVFEINHPSASEPFGLDAPSSKVSFDNGSTYKISTNSPGALKLNGRVYPNLHITGNSSVHVNEFLTMNTGINDLTIDQGSKLFIKNLESSLIPDLNIKGNLNINGELCFLPDETHKIKLNFNRGSIQNISGSGIIEFSNGLKSINIHNDLTLNANIDAYCHVIHKDGTINTNGNTFRIFNQYTSAQMLFTGIIIMPIQSPEGKPVNVSPEMQKTNEGAANSPREFSISQNYPNPFNPVTKIDFAVPVNSKVNVSVFDITGKRVAELINDQRETDYYSIEFNGSNLASSIYFYRITAEGSNGKVFSKTMKMSLVK